MFRGRLTPEVLATISCLETFHLHTPVLKAKVLCIQQPADGPQDFRWAIP